MFESSINLSVNNGSAQNKVDSERKLLAKLNNNWMNSYVEQCDMKNSVVDSAVAKTN